MPGQQRMRDAGQLKGLRFACGTPRVQSTINLHISLPAYLGLYLAAACNIVAYKGQLLPDNGAFDSAVRLRDVASTSGRRKDARGCRDYRFTGEARPNKGTLQDVLRVNLSGSAFCQRSLSHGASEQGAISGRASSAASDGETSG